MPDDDDALVHVRQHVLGVTEISLNRPAAMNALSVEFMQAIGSAVRNVSRSSPSVIVVTSTCDKAFGVGADLKERARMTTSDLMDCRPQFRAAYRALLDLPCPVLVALHGFALGGALEIALTGDLIIADETTVVGLPEVRIGLIPGGGGSQLLGRRTGWGPAADLIFTGRRVAADEALSLGIIDRLVPTGTDRESSLELATNMAGASPNSLALAKEALRAGWGRDIELGLDLEDDLWRRAATSADRAEGIQAFVQKRSPEWPSRRSP